MRTEEEIQEAKEKRRAYMRDYKRKQYAKDKDNINCKQKIYYHKKTNPGLKTEALKTFTVMQHEFTKVYCNMEYPDVLKEYLQSYFVTWRKSDQNTLIH